ncbi:MAG: DUF1475 family protein [Gammaproteobacteria bacterium]
MQARSGLRILFGTILVTMIVVTSWASLRQPVWHWGGLTRTPDNAWTIATLFDACFGFVTFYTWVAYKERSWLPRIGWLIAILLLGNMAMAAYVLLQLRKLPANEPMATLLTARHD